MLDLKPAHICRMHTAVIHFDGNHTLYNLLER